MSCSGGCSTATGHQCRCSCGGALHGTGRIEWARFLRDPESMDPSPKLIRARSVRKRTSGLVRECLVRFRRNSKRRTRVRHEDADASAEYSRSVEAVDWLIDHPTEAQQIEWLASKIGEIGTEAVVDLSVDKRHRLGDHFWCDVTVALVETIEDILDAKNQAIKDFSKEAADLIAELVWAKVEESRKASDGRRAVAERDKPRATRAEIDRQQEVSAATLRPLVNRVVAAAVDAAFAPVDAQLQVTLIKLRVLTLMLCPDPYSHEAVLKHCLHPMAREVLTDTVHEELLQFVQR